LAEAANFTFRAVPVRAARCRWQYAEGIFSVTDAELEMPDGRLTGSYSVNVETMDFEARLDGTFAPKTIEPLMTAKQREFLAQFEFGDAVRATNARIRGNWHFPKEIQMAGNLRLGRWTWRGESFTGLSADVRLDSEVITFSNATVKRPQGEARAEFCYDGAEGWLTVEAKGSLFPKRLVAAAFPKLRQALEPYEVEAPVVFDIRARGNTRWADSMMVEGRVEFGAATARGVGIVGGEAQFRYESGVARISHFELRRPEGAATGALVWDTRQRTVRGELVSTLNVHAMAPVFGEKFMKAIEPYQFGSPPLVWAEGIVSLSEGERTRIKLRIEGTEFTLTVPRPLAKHEGGNGQAGGAPANANGDAVAPPIRLCASKISGDLSYGQDSLTLRNVDAEFYGGKLRGSADFMFASGKVTYRGALQVERASLAQVLDAFTGKQGNVSGLLSGAAQIDDGTWGDLRTLRGQGRADILDGHLVDVPVFGLASFILNMLPGKPGNSKARTASATFVCADGLIRTEDLAVETGGTKTTMKGTVSWDGAIDFEVRTRGSNLFNVLIDPLRWLTDAHVTGTLSKPEAAPLRLK
jgi:hypothetical protein